MNRYKIFGEIDSTKTIIALPALGERKDIYESLSRYLSEYKIIAIDLPGHKQTQQADYSISKYLLEIRSIMKELKILIKLKFNLVFNYLVIQ